MANGKWQMLKSPNAKCQMPPNAKLWSNTKRQMPNTQIVLLHIHTQQILRESSFAFDRMQACSLSLVWWSIDSKAIRKIKRHCGHTHEKKKLKRCEAFRLFLWENVYSERSKCNRQISNSCNFFGYLLCTMDRCRYRYATQMQIVFYPQPRSVYSGERMYVNDKEQLTDKWMLN